MTEIPDESKVIELGDKLLVRTFEYCEGAYQDQAIIKTQIDKIILRLDKTVDPNEIIKLSTAIKTLKDVYNSLQERSVIGFMAQYKPLKNLMDSIKSSDIPDVSDTHPDTPTLTSSVSDVPDTHPYNTLDVDFNISEIYKKYED